MKVFACVLLAVAAHAAPEADPALLYAGYAGLHAGVYGYPYAAAAVVPAASVVTGNSVPVAVGGYKAVAGSNGDLAGPVHEVPGLVPALAVQKQESSGDVSLSTGTGALVHTPVVTYYGKREGVCQGVTAALGGGKVEAVINVAGGWAGGNAANADWVKNADLMWKQSVWSSAISCTISAKHLGSGGLLVLPGAKPCVGGTPGMMGYGMAKAAVHQLVKSCGTEGSGLPAGSCTLGLLPVTLDTPMNRKFMPDADKSTWTPLEEVARIMAEWTKGKGRLVSGSLVALITQSGNTRLETC